MKKFTVVILFLLALFYGCTKNDSSSPAGASGTPVPTPNVFMYTGFTDGKIYFYNLATAQKTTFTSTSLEVQSMDFDWDREKVIISSSKDSPGGKHAIYESGIASPVFDQKTNTQSVKYAVCAGKYAYPYYFVAAANWCQDVDVYAVDSMGNTPMIKDLPSTTNYAWIRYSKQADRLVFVVQDGGRSRIGVMNGDGTGYQVLTSGANDDEQPDISRDGTKIVFKRYTSGAGDDLFIINYNGSGLDQLTSDVTNKIENFPSFSPDGTEIVYTKEGVIQKMKLADKSTQDIETVLAQNVVWWK